MLQRSEGNQKRTADNKHKQKPGHRHPTEAKVAAVSIRAASGRPAEPATGGPPSKKISGPARAESEASFALAGSRPPSYLRLLFIFVCFLLFGVFNSFGKVRATRPSIRQSTKPEPPALTAFRGGAGGAGKEPCPSLLLAAHISYIYIYIYI